MVGNMKKKNEKINKIEKQLYSNQLKIKEIYEKGTRGKIS